MTEIEITFILNNDEIKYLKDIVGLPWQSDILETLFHPHGEQNDENTILDGLIEKGFIQIKEQTEVIDTIVIRLVKRLVNATEVESKDDVTRAITSVGIIVITPDQYQKNTWHIQMKGTQ